MPNDQHLVSLITLLKSPKQRRQAYLVATIVLASKTPYHLLIVNTLMLDLQSSVPSVAFGALNLLVRTANTDSLPMLLPHVATLLSSSTNTTIRRRAILAFGVPLLCQGYSYRKLLKRALADPDPHITAACVNTYSQISKLYAADCVPLTGAFLHIFEQVLAGNFGASFVYCGMQAPWLKLDIISILGCIGSEQTLLDAPRKQCIEMVSKALSSIDPNQQEPLGFGTRGLN